MPIKNMTGQYRPVRRGKIHLGVKVKTTKKCKCMNRSPDKKPKLDCIVCKGTGLIFRPEEVNYFVLGDAPELKATYGDKPKVLHVTVLPARIEKENFDQYLEKLFPQYLKWYKLTGLWCKGDGEMAERINEETGTLDEVDCPCEHLESKDCKRNAILRFRIQEIASFNVYQISTTSWNSICIPVASASFPYTHTSESIST